jgi:methylmalonyl-CoA mutase cobalamin-binding subunit
VPLSEEELRLLEQMERALVAEDPKFVSALRGTERRRHARRRALVAGGVFVLGVAVLMTGAVMATTPVAIVGFIVMLGSAVLALSSWRGQSASGAPEQPEAADGTGAGFGLSVVEGGKKSKSKKRSPRSRQRPSNQSMMERFEERWRRRRGSNGF